MYVVPFFLGIFLSVSSNFIPIVQVKTNTQIYLLKSHINYYTKYKLACSARFIPTHTLF